MGRSGACKSTLVKLLTRRHLVTGGRIRIDGQDIESVTQESIAAAIGEVPQATEMFHRSIRENIRYGRPLADNAATERAAIAAGCDEFIVARPGGYVGISVEQDKCGGACVHSAHILYKASTVEQVDLRQDGGLGGLDTGKEFR